VSSPFVKVTAHRPCPRCGHDSWCMAARDGSAVMCMRDLVGFDGATREMADGTPYGYHWTGAPRGDVAPPPASRGPACAPTEVRDRAYRAMLDSFELSEQHRQHLRHRGLSPDQVATLTLAGYRTLPDYHERARAIRAAIDSLGGGDPLAIPGLHRGNSSWRLAGRPGLLIPVRDVAGRIVACKIRPDDPGPDGGKYVWLSSAAHDGASPGAPAHVAAIRGGAPLRIVEGVLKADIAAALDPSTSVVGIPSCTAISTARDAMRALAPGRVLLAWDGDADVNPHVARGLARAVEVVREVCPGAAIAAETWDRAHKGVDDALAAEAVIATREDVAEHAAELIARADAAEAARKAAKAPAVSDAATPAPAPAPAPGDARIAIEVTDREHAVNDAVLGALAHEPDLYARGGALARVALDPSPVDPRPPRIEDLPPESLRELISRRVAFHTFKPDRRGVPQRVVEHPPTWCVGAIHRRGAWPGVRPLTGVIDAPVLRRDGTVLAEPGYDLGTGLYFASRHALPPIPESPTAAQGDAAMGRIVAMLEEFPFDATSIEGDPHASWQLNLGAAVSLIFTLVARPMIAGPLPGYLIDAPDAGAGKTLLAKVLVLMGSGHLPDAERWHEDEDEWGKVHLGNLLEGRRVVFFDNVTTGGTFGHGGFDGALTQWPLWKGRILGQTGNVAVRNDCLVVATGNNPRVPNDTIRRLVRVRLRPDEERRAETEIAYRNRLPGDAVRDVAELLAAAATALRAWICAGRPTTRLTPWGSFEEWAAIVPQCLAWYGYPDIHRTQDGLRAADDDADALGLLLAGWHAFGGADGASTTAVLNALRGPSPIGAPRAAGIEGIREGLEGLDPRRLVAQQNAKTLGRLLAKFEGKIVNGLRLARSGHKGADRKWIVQTLAGAAARPAEPVEGADGVRGFLN
jgi:hypothetical protein